MSLLKTYYFELYHHDVEPIVTSSNLWGVQGEYVTELEHVGYTNWIDEDGGLQSVIPSGADVAMFINTDYNVVLDVDVAAHSIVIGADATLSLNGNRSLAIVESVTLNGLILSSVILALSLLTQMQRTSLRIKPFRSVELGK